MQTTYTELVRRSKELGVLNSCAAVLAWDQLTYMPTNGANLRGEQMALLASLAHQKFTDPKIGELLAAVEASDLVTDPESDAAANGRELRRNYDRATKLPQALVEELARVTTQAQQVWQTAKAKKGMADAFDATPATLGRAAVKAAGGAKPLPKLARRARRVGT